MAAPARAADMPMVYKAAPVVVEQFGGWYLRGDIGMTNQKVNAIDNVLFDLDRSRCCNKDFDSGDAVRSRRRLSVQRLVPRRRDRRISRQHRPSAASTPIRAATNDYYGTKSEWLFLANAYIDLGTWWCVTPFVGAGIGYSRNTIGQLP